MKNEPLTSCEVLDVLHNISNKYEINGWLYKNVNIWPVFCEEVMNYLTYVKLDKSNNRVTKNNQFKRILNGAFDLLDLSIFKRNRKIVILDHTFMSVSLNEDRHRQFFVRTLDSLLLEEVVIFQQPEKFNNDKFYKSTYSLGNFRSLFGIFKVLFLNKSRFNFLINGLNQAIDEIKILRNSDYDLTCLSIHNKLDNIYIYKILFKVVLKLIKPNVIYLTYYYISPGYALSWAASELDIKTVEFQHGNIFNYPPYCSFWDPPSVGYTLIPNVLKCWNKKSYDQYQSWASKTNKHSAVISGNEWHQYCKSLITTTKYDLFNGGYCNNKKTILLTLVPEVNPMPEIIVDAIRCTANNYNWMIRLHPRQLNDIDAIVKLYKNNDVHDIIIKESTFLPLPIVLSFVDVHITSWSSCAIDAYEFSNLPTICIDKEGAERYVGQLPDTHIVVFEGKNGYDLSLLIDKTINFNK